VVCETNHDKGPLQPNGECLRRGRVEAIDVFKECDFHIPAVGQDWHLVSSALIVLKKVSPAALRSSFPCFSCNRLPAVVAPHPAPAPSVPRSCAEGRFRGQQANRCRATHGKIDSHPSTAQTAGMGQPYSLCAEFRGWSLCHDVPSLWQNTKPKARKNSETGLGLRAHDCVRRPSIANQIFSAILVLSKRSSS